jgi:hypothetical protein
MRLMSSAGAETMNMINRERTKKLKVVVQIRIFGPKNSFAQFKKKIFLLNTFLQILVRLFIIFNRYPQYLS